MKGLWVTEGLSSRWVYLLPSTSENYSSFNWINSCGWSCFNFVQKNMYAPCLTGRTPKGFEPLFFLHQNGKNNERSLWFWQRGFFSWIRTNPTENQANETTNETTKKQRPITQVTNDQPKGLWRNRNLPPQLQKIWTQKLMMGCAYLWLATASASSQSCLWSSWGWPGKCFVLN